MIRFFDVKAGFAELSELITPRVDAIIANGPYIGGPACSAFEENFASFVGADRCVGCGNGLDALALALQAYGIGKGDEVIVPSHTYIATWLAVTANSARVVPVEPDTRTMLIETDDIAAAVTERTRAIIPVHLYGLPVDMPGIERLARKHGLKIIADAAQAHGAAIEIGNERQPIGAFGDVACWSFYPAKNLGAAGDGGAITTADNKVAERVRQLSNYGSSIKYHNELRGTNSRLDPVQAAILDVKLAALEEWNIRRNAIANRYFDALDGLDLILPPRISDRHSAWHQFVIRLNNRDAVARRLAERGIQTLIHYPVPPHLQPAYYDHRWKAGAFPIAEHMADTVLSLPIGPHMAMDDVDTVCTVLAEILAADE
ncbi:MAG: DegT/DnrJ/EryC1/StrS family aminotransferase [Pontixanthobacter sp.]